MSAESTSSSRIKDVVIAVLISGIFAFSRGVSYGKDQLAPTVPATVPAATSQPAADPPK